MKMAELHEMVMSLDPVNAEYILKDSRLLEMAEWHEEYKAAGKENLVISYAEDIEKRIREFDERRLVPSNAKVGEGATVLYYTDRKAGTIVKATKKMIVIREDKATLDPEWKPEFIPGGFVGTVINQNEQTYTYEPNPNGRETKLFWSDKYQTYGQPNNLRAMKGRHEFYDYNF